MADFFMNGKQQIALSIFLMFLFLLCEFLKIDLKLADYLYSLQGGQWALKNHWFTDRVVHDLGKKLVILVSLVFLGVLFMSYRYDRMRLYRGDLWRIFFSVAGTIVLVGILKKLTHMDSPWSLQRYGGTVPYVSLFESHPGTFPNGNSFPAGHASGAYAWMAIYFFAIKNKFDWGNMALLISIIFGLIFGISQQLRGAHFLSHDIFTVWLAWTMPMMIFFDYRKVV